MKKAFLKVLAVIFICGLTLTFSTTSTRAEFPEKTLKVGIIGPLTGPVAPWGTAFHHGTELMLDDVNAVGGLVVGGVRYKFKAFVEDDKYNAAIAAEAAQRLVFQEKVNYMIGPFGSEGCFAAIPLLKRNRILQLVVAGDDRILDPANEYTFRVYSPNSMRSVLLFDWILKTNPDIRKAASLTRGDVSGKSAGEFDTKYLGEKGLEITDMVFFERGTTDFVPFLTKILAKKPDLISISGSAPPSAALICKQSRAMGYIGLIATVGPLGAQDLLPLAGSKEVLDGFITTAPIIDLPYYTPEIRALPKKEEAKYGEVLPSTGDFFTYFSLLPEAIKRAGSVESTDLKRILEDTTQVWPFRAIPKGELRFGAPISIKLYGDDRSRHQASHPFLITQIKDGKDVVASVATP